MKLDVWRRPQDLITVPGCADIISPRGCLLGVFHPQLSPTCMLLVIITHSFRVNELICASILHQVGHSVIIIKGHIRHLHWRLTGMHSDTLTVKKDTVVDSSF